MSLVPAKIILTMRCLMFRGSPVYLLTDKSTKLTDTTDRNILTG